MNLPQIILTICITFLFISSIKAQDPIIEKPTLKDECLKGKVKQIKQDAFKAELQSNDIINGPRDNSEYPIYQYKFNPEGICIELDEHREIGAVDESYTKRYKEKYNADGNLTESTLYEIDEWPNMDSLIVTYRSSLTFNSNGQLMKEDYYNKSNLFEFDSVQILYEYNNSGKLIGYNWYKTDGKVARKYELKYNNKGNLIQETYFKYIGSLPGKRIIIYNESDEKIEEDLYNSDGIFERRKYNLAGQLIAFDRLYQLYYGVDSSKTTYSYNVDGSISEMNVLHFGPKNEHQKITYTYDEKGKILIVNDVNSLKFLSSKIVHVYDSVGNLIEKTEYDSKMKLRENHIWKYDDNGNAIEHRWYSLMEAFVKPDDRHIEKMEYDVQGNFVKLIRYENEEPTYLVQREILYY